jgi:hypothetical protein
MRTCRERLKARTFSSRERWSWRLRSWPRSAGYLGRGRSWRPFHSFRFMTRPRFHSRPAPPA